MQLQLTVNNGVETSDPHLLTIIVVQARTRIFEPEYDQLILENLVGWNEPFDPNKPTFVYFGGGNCSGMGRGGIGPGPWRANANVFSRKGDEYYYPEPGGRPYVFNQLANELLIKISAAAPYYSKPIQTAGFSAGGLPCLGVPVFLNTTYNDDRYSVNRVSILDALVDGTCGESNFDYDGHIDILLNTLPDGKPVWIDNYYSYGGMSHTQPKTFNVQIAPGHWDCWMAYRDSGDPIISPAMLEYKNNMACAFYISVAGPGANLELPHPIQTGYFNSWIGDFITGQLTSDDPEIYATSIPEPVTLAGPADGDAIDANGVVLSSLQSQNVIGYQLLLGGNPDRIADFILISDTPQPPTETVTVFPFDKTYWTIRAYDQYGASIYANPEAIFPDQIAAVTNLITNVTSAETYSTIQKAIDAAINGDEIILDPSAYPYVESIDLKGKSITIRSIDPNDPNIVAATIIQGNFTDPAVSMKNSEDANCILDGLTITKGGVGILCDASFATIRNCTIKENLLSAIDLWSIAEPQIINCIIEGQILNHVVENLNTAQKYGSIQEAIDQSLDGHHIVIHQSLYQENLNLNGKKITLSSINPNDPDITAGTIIKALDPNLPAITLNNAEDSSCTIAGFTITNGYSGIYCSGTSPKISNCVITDNSGEDGGGICCDNGAAPRIDRCLISGNYASAQGGGISRSFAEISNSVIINNRAKFSGGGIYVHSAAITNCLIAGNYPEGIDLSRNSTLVQITNCTIVENYAQGLDMGKPVFRNCIVAGNDEAGTNVQISGTFANVEYCLVEDGFAGAGNIDDDPCFATPGSWADVNTWNQGDYHLKSEFGTWDSAIKAWTIDAVTSAAIDAGDATSTWQGEKWPHGARVNLGVYGNTVEASMSGSQAGNQADANNDQNVNLWDFTELAFNWNETAKCVYADLNADAAVNEFDLKILTDNWLWADSE
jgi:predicted outer membrane repeat protein